MVVTSAFGESFNTEVYHRNRRTEPRRTNALQRLCCCVSAVVLLTSLPLAIITFLVFACHLTLPFTFQLVANAVNYSNSFVNPDVYALRIRQFKQALAECCLGGKERLNNDVMALTQAMIQLRTLRADPCHLQLAFEQEVMDINEELTGV